MVAEAVRCCAHLTDPRLTRVGGAVCGALSDAEAWLDAARAAGPDSLHRGARRFALQVGRALELGLLAAHAQWALGSQGAGAAPRLKALAGRFAAHGVAHIFQEDTAGHDPAR